MKYLDNISLKYSIKHIQFSEIKYILLKIIKIIIYLNHNLNIYINDLHFDNIIYHNKKIIIIDFLDFMSKTIKIFSLNNKKINFFIIFIINMKFTKIIKYYQYYSKVNYMYLY